MTNKKLRRSLAAGVFLFYDIKLWGQNRYIGHRRRGILFNQEINRNRGYISQ
jgi:hypothetical protein